MSVNIPQSEHGGPHPELAARVTNAKAAHLDFNREVDAYVTSSDGTRPDFEAWAFRLSAELNSLITILERS